MKNRLVNLVSIIAYLTFSIWLSARNESFNGIDFIILLCVVSSAATMGYCLKVNIDKLK